MVLAFAAIGVRLFDLQARDRSHLASLGLGQRVRTVTLPAERGSIFDRNGKVLAVSVPQTTIVADPRVIKDPVAYAAKLAPIVQVDQAAARGAPVEPQERVRVRRPQGRRRGRRARCASSTSSASRAGESRRFYPNGRSRGRWSASSAPTTTVSAASSTTTRRLLTGKPGERAGRARPAGQRDPRW